MAAGSGGGEGPARKGRKSQCRQNQYMVSSMAPDGNECACTLTRVCNECWCARARVRVHEGACTCVRASRQLVRVCARAPADAGADRIDGRALLAASRLDSREDGKATHLEQSWR